MESSSTPQGPPDNDGKQRKTALKWLDDMSFRTSKLRVKKKMGKCWSSMIAYPRVQSGKRFRRLRRKSVSISVGGETLQGSEDQNAIERKNQRASVVMGFGSLAANEMSLTAAGGAVSPIGDDEIARESIGGGNSNQDPGDMITGETQDLHPDNPTEEYHDPEKVSVQDEDAGKSSAKSSREESEGPKLEVREDPTSSRVVLNMSIPREDYNQLVLQWRRMRKLREQIWGLRSRAQEQRVVLRDKQADKAAVDDRYIKLVRLQQAQTLSQPVRGNIKLEGKTLEELRENCEKARAEFGPLEDDFTILEDSLGRREWELSRLEEKFVERSGIFDKLFEGANVEGSVEDGGEEFTRSNSASEEEVTHYYHPMVGEYLSKLGDVDILRERLDWHLDETDFMRSEKEKREIVGLKLASEDEAWLEVADDEETRLREELDDALVQAENLRSSCVAEGLLDENGQLKTLEAQELQMQEEGAFIEEGLDSEGTKSEYSKFPKLLPYLGTKKEVTFKDSGPEIGEVSGGAGDHINQWLLHRTRGSALDVELLSRTFEEESGHSSTVEGAKWESDVLSNWWRDGAIKAKEAYIAYSAGGEVLVAEQEEENTPLRRAGSRSPSRSNSDSETESVDGGVLVGDGGIVVDFLPRAK